MTEIKIDLVPVEQIEVVTDLIHASVSDQFSSLLGFHLTGHELLRHTAQDPDFDPDLLIGAYAGNELVGVIFGVQRPWKSTKEDTGYIKFVFVKNENRRQGIGRSLLDACERRLVGLGARVLVYGSSSPRYLLPGVPAGDLETQKFLSACGWSERSERVNLDLSLGKLKLTQDDLEILLDDNGCVSVEVAQSLDEREVLRFIETEFSYSWALESCRAFVAESDGFCSVIKENDTGRILGFAAVNASNPHWFGPMGIREDAQMSGLGRMLVTHALLTAKQRGINHVLFPWVNENEGFYRKVIGDLDREVFLKYEKVKV